jgi:hypothetical protein
MDLVIEGNSIASIHNVGSPGSEKWNAVRDELIALDFTLDPTLTIYEANRDLMREMNADWQVDYAHPRLWAFFQPSRKAHGSYWFDWTTADEIAWKENYRLWMTFLDDYKNHGGRVTLGSDSGFIWKLYGFGYIREMELLQEARAESGTGPGLDRLPYIPE